LELFVSQAVDLVVQTVLLVVEQLQTLAIGLQTGLCHRLHVDVSVDLASLLLLCPALCLFTGLVFLEDVLEN
jgi:hypothetical protein